MGADIDGEAAGNDFGIGVSISGDGNIIAIGAPRTDGNGSDSGSVRLYTYYGLNSSVPSKLPSSVPCDAPTSGPSVGPSLISSDEPSSVPSLTPTESFMPSYAKMWNQMGADIDGEAADDQSGWMASLSSDGNIVAIGARKNDGNGSNSGHVRVYKFDATSSDWNQMGVDIDGEAAGDELGHSVSLSSGGNIVAIGAILNDGNGSNSGHVRVYQFNDTENSWNQKGADIDGEAAEDRNGYRNSLSSDGNVVAVSARYNDGNGSNSGHVRVYIFESTSSQWNQMGSDIDGEAAGDFSGYVISLSDDGNIVAIGARYNDGNGSNPGHVRVYNYDSTSSQ
jgi:hypothetical protein